MFPFSSFASDIPLFVLAFVYMLYFGTYALKKAKPNYNDDIHQEKEQSVKCSSCEQVRDAFYYQQSSNEKQAKCSEESEFDIFPDQFNSSIKYIPDRKISLNFCEFSLLSRPPPFLA